MKFPTRFRSARIGAAVAMMAICAATTMPASAQELRIATSYKLMTLDPHYSCQSQGFVSRLFVNRGGPAW